MTIQKRKLGTTDLQVAPIIFGGNVFGWTIDEQKSFTVLDAFVGEGFDCIDTADVYSAWVPGHKGGESETIIGKWMQQRKNRSQIKVITKVGMDIPNFGSGLKKDHILKSVEQSLQRLQTDYIDLYLAHRDVKEAPLEETLAAFDSLVKSGKVRHIGCSNYAAGRIEEALKVSKELGLASYSVLEPEYNLYDRAGFETALEKTCVQNHLGVISYYSLASGFLSGKYRSEADTSKSARGGGVKQKYLNEKGYRILKALDEVAAESKSNPTQVSLAWLLHKPAVTAPIVSATSVEQLQDLIHAPRVKLSSAQMALLDQVSQ